METWDLRSPNQINKKSSRARFRLDGLDWDFRLMCSSLLSVKSVLTSFKDVFLSVYKDKFWGPKMAFLRVSVSMICEGFA